VTRARRRSEAARELAKVRQAEPATRIFYFAPKQ
jgi:hypothetical protein